MKPALSSCFSLLTCVLACWALNGTEESLCTKEALCARGLVIPIDDQLRQVAVWTGNGSRVVLGLGVARILSSKEKWLNFTAIQNGSGYCVSSEAFTEDYCNEDLNYLHLWSSRETKWNLEPANMVSGCSQYYLLGIGLDLHDSPTKLLWRPGKRAMSLYLNLWGSGTLKVFRKADSQLQYDMTIRRASGDAPCVVTSATLDVARICQQNQTGIYGIAIVSIDDDDDPTPSYFSFDCEDDAGRQNSTGTPSPDDKITEGTDQDSDSDMDLEVSLVLLNVIISIFLLGTVFI